MKQPARAVATCLLGAGLLAAYASPLAAMMQRWDSPMYSYAYAVPPIALFLLWSRRRELRERPPRPARLAGGVVLASALIVLTLGQVAAFQVVQQLSFLVALVGLVLFLFGWAHLRICAPALGYLLFMVPLWDALTEPLHWPFQNYSAKLGVALLHTIGIPAYREATVIALPNMTIEVARQCSGVNYLVAVLALAVPISFVRLQGWWRPILLIASSTVIAALANGLRVALISALAHWEFTSALHGPMHVLHGLFVAGVGYLVLFVGLNLLERQQGTRPVEPTPAPTGPIVHSMWTARVATSLAMVFWFVALLGTRTMAVPVALATPLDRLPLQLGSWVIEPLPVSAEETSAEWSGADSQILRRYQGRDGRSATLGIWYFEAQRQDHEIVSSKAGALHRGATTHVITLGDGTTLTTNVIRSDKDLGIFWYELDGVPEASQHAAKLRSLWTALVSRRSNGAVIMLRSAAGAGSDADVLRALDDLVVQVHGALARQWRHARPVGTVPDNVRESDRHENRG